MDVRREHDRLVEYLLALGEAAEALERARRQFPDPGLDHAIERLRLQSNQFAARLRDLAADPP